MAKRHRSPAYPSLKISEAMKRVQQFYDAETINPAPVKVAVSHWGYGEKSSGGSSVISALKAYGLMHDEGAGATRMVRLTQDALNYVYDTRDDPTDRNKILARCALKPKIIRDLFEKYLTSQVSDASLDFYLKQQGYNPNAVSDIIKVYRDALNYVDGNAYDVDKEDPNTGEKDTATKGNEASVDGFLQQSSDSLGKSNNDSAEDKNESGTTMKQDTFNIDEGQIVLQFPVEMTIDSFEDFTDWLLLQHRKIGRSVEVEEGKSKPKLKVKD